MNRYLFVYGLVLLLLLAIIACGDGEAPSPTTPPTPTTQPEATPTQEPSPTVAPTASAEPTATSQGTVSPTATIQPTVAAPATATPTSPPPPTDTPAPTATPTATSPPTPTNTPEPTVAATATPPPTPTNTPEPPVASTITIGPSKDNTLYESADGLLSNGAGDYIFVGSNNGGSVRRGVIAFDIVGNIPSGASITSVGLTLNLSKTQAAGQTVQLRRLLADWGEGASNASANEGRGIAPETGDVTWIHTRFNSETWQTEGGDFATAASASTTVVGAGKYTWDSTGTMVADVQGQLEDPSTNFGWLLLGNEGERQTSKRFDSKENPFQSNRPVLTIEFTSR